MKVLVLGESELGVALLKEFAGLGYEITPITFLDEAGFLAVDVGAALPVIPVVGESATSDEEKNGES